MKKVSIRWTIGDVNISGFEALRLSISGMWKIFGEQAGYTVCVNTIDIDEAKERQDRSKLMLNGLNQN